MCVTSALPLPSSHLLGVICQGVVGVNEEDVLWLEICVGEFVVMQELDSITQLVGDVSDLIEGIRTVVVVLLQRERKKICNLKLYEVKESVTGNVAEEKRRGDTYSNDQ